MANRLAHETSPYLRQHRDNPVDWWPWCDEALAHARATHRPILLSIGYSACHWCHVMAHESFEHADTAALMNALFVNIKVDREERPDLDRIYQLAHQALAQRAGGWPLTVFLTPDDHMPFFAGTYFPREPRYGMPPFAQVLRQVRQWFDQRQDDLRRQNAALGEFLAGMAQTRVDTTLALHDAPIRAALNLLRRHHDTEHGGFGSAPKFPRTSDLELLRQRAPDGAWAELAEHTLACMAAGGIHDQLGGGFCRYSVDARWAIPHFEKMLYDNALLLPLYAEAARDCTDASMRETLAAAARGIVAWLQREMRAPGGGWYAALDADTEGEEGKFYVWQRDEVHRALTPEQWAVAEPHWGLDQPPNFEEHAWHLCVVESLDSIARRLGVSPTDAAARIDAARIRLLALRATRVRPGLDDKRLTCWNAMLAAGLIRAARALDDPQWAELGERTLDFLHAQAWRERLYASVDSATGARFPGYLDDYAYTLDAMLESLACHATRERLNWAQALADELLARFEDDAGGGFYFTAHDHERLIVRSKSFFDESIPAGNAVAARALLRLGHALGETRYLDAAWRALRAAWPTLNETPQACAAMLAVLDEALAPPASVVLCVPDRHRTNWQTTVDALHVRGVSVWVLDAATAWPGLLGERRGGELGTAYVCRGTQCDAPYITPEALRAAFAAERVS
jgi:hypothetical protein